MSLQNLILPTINDLKFSTIKFNENCEYLQDEKGCSSEGKQYILDLITYCMKIKPFVHCYKDQVSSYNHTTHNILKNKIDLILPQFHKINKKTSIIGSLISGFIGLAYEVFLVFYIIEDIKPNIKQ